MTTHLCCQSSRQCVCYNDARASSLHQPRTFCCKAFVRAGRCWRRADVPRRALRDRYSECRRDCCVSVDGGMGCRHWHARGGGVKATQCVWWWFSPPPLGCLSRADERAVASCRVDSALQRVQRRRADRAAGAAGRELSHTSVLSRLACFATRDPAAVRVGAGGSSRSRVVRLLGHL